MKNDGLLTYRFILPEKQKIIALLATLLIIFSNVQAQETTGKFFSGNPRFITPTLGTIMVVESQNPATDNNDSLRTSLLNALTDLAGFVNKANNDSAVKYKDFRTGNATKIGIIGIYNMQNTLFYCNVSDADDLMKNRITLEEFNQRVQSLPMADFVIITEGQGKKTFIGFMKMDHPFYSFPMRISFLLPFGLPDGFKDNMGFELSDLWSRPKSVANLKFQISMIWLNHRGEDWYERFIIPSFNMGISFNFLGDSRFNLRPYITLGWNPTYYYFKNSDTTNHVLHKNLDNNWYFMTGSVNYGIDLEGWILKKLGFSVAIEQNQYLAALIPDIYGSTKAISLDYLTFKIGILW